MFCSKREGLRIECVRLGLIGISSFIKTRQVRDQFV